MRWFCQIKRCAKYLPRFQHASTHRSLRWLYQLFLQFTIYRYIVYIVGRVTVQGDIRARARARNRNRKTHRLWPHRFDYDYDYEHDYDYQREHVDTP